MANGLLLTVTCCPNKLYYFIRMEDLAIRNRGGRGGIKSGKTEREKRRKRKIISSSHSVCLPFSCVVQPAVLKAVVTRQGNPHFLAPSQEVRIASISL